MSNAEHYVLIDVRTKKTALMKDGRPFLYTTDWTARLGAKYLGMKRKAKFKVAPRFTGAIVS